jgi:ADP-ribose pyrophosphatase YjhB (NUDIX family)
MAVGQSAGPILRFSARILLIDSYDRVLLLRATGDEDPSFWVTPGGVVEAGEGWEDAARRELWEETGLEPVDLGPAIWKRTHAFVWAGKRYESHERFFLVRTQPFTPAPAALEGMPERPIGEHKWWLLDEIEQATGEVFVPRALGKYLRELMEGRYPDPESPIDVGV